MRRMVGMATVLLVATACGGEKSYYCDFRDAPADAEDRCQERSNSIPGGGEVAKQAFLDTCDLAQGVSGSGGCPLDGATVGCDYGTAGAETVIDWYYGENTRASVEQSCLDDNGTLIDP